MKQLTLGNILDFVAVLRKENMSMQEIRNMPVYIGDDDELNGIHCAWYTNIVDANDNDDDNQYLVEMINDSYGNVPLKGKALLIS